jgi:hypothetical protein
LRAFDIFSNKEKNEEYRGWGAEEIVGGCIGQYLL